jgi:predicted TIM-barrel fold metal-dependent hydrolase
MDTPVVDFHAHTSRSGRVRTDDEPSRYMAIMDAAGIDMACVNTLFMGEARRCNDRSAAFAEANPDRFFFAAFVTPLYPEEMIPELERAVDVLGARFIKIYPDYIGKPLEDPIWVPIFEWVNERGLPIMSHAILADGTDAAVTITERYTGLCERFPRVKWVMAHAAGGGGPDAINAARTLPDVYMETCSSSGTYRAVQDCVNGAGADRVLFGTDMPLLDARREIAKVVTADISDDAKRRVLGLNAIELLGLEGLMKAA